MTAEINKIRIEGLTVTFSRWGQTVSALNDLNLAVPSGQWVMLVGPNGSGKSTLLGILSGRLRPDLGNAQIDGRSVLKMATSEMAAHVFCVRQDPLLGTAPTLTLFENLLVADHDNRSRKEPRSELMDKYDELLRPLGLAGRLKQLALNLSGGERQLLAILIARLRPSGIMLLDEPFAALDPAKTELCLEQVRLMQTAGKTILQVTHDPDLMVRGGDRTVVLVDGTIVSDVCGQGRDLHDLGGYLSAWRLPKE